MENVLTSGVRAASSLPRGWISFVRHSSGFNTPVRCLFERYHEQTDRRKVVQSASLAFYDHLNLILSKRWSTSTVRNTPLDTDTFSDGDAVLHLSPSCVKRLKKLQNEEPNKNLVLRIGVEGGGCSGFQYNFKLDHKVGEDDRIFEDDGAKIVVDTMSLDFIKGATIDWNTELIRSAFRIVDNPKAEHGCSCGSSFSVKI